MEAWRSTFRDGVAPQLSTPGLKALEPSLAALRGARGVTT